MFGNKKVTCAALVVVALALPGCSIAGEAANQGAKSVLDLMRDDPSASLRKAVEKTADVTSATMVVKGTEGNEKQDMTIKARFGAKPAAEMAMTVEGKPMTIVVDGAVFLVALPPESAVGPLAGKKWIKVDMATLPKDKVKGFGIDTDELTGMFEELNPKRQLQRMIDMGELKAIGEEPIGGIKTMHYTSTTTVAKALAGMAAKDRESNQKKYTTGNVKDVVVDLWVDEKYQLARSKYHAGAVDDWTAQYTAYNTTVIATAPPAAEVIDFATLVKKGVGA